MRVTDHNTNLGIFIAVKTSLLITLTNYYILYLSGQNCIINENKQHIYCKTQKNASFLLVFG